MGRKTNSIERVYSNSVEEGECLVWSLGKDKDGYGVTAYNWKKIPAHRLVGLLTWGVEALEGKYVLHKCNNPSCVKVEHLYIGTQKQNIQDQKDAGTFVCGSKNGRAKLTEEDISNIRNSTQTCSELTTLYNVHYSTMWDIMKGKTWTHVT